MVDLTKRQIEIMKLLDEHGSRNMAQLKTSQALMDDLYWRRPRLAEGWFYKTGSTKDDRWWGLTDAGRAALAEADPNWTIRGADHG